MHSAYRAMIVSILTCIGIGSCFITAAHTGPNNNAKIAGHLKTHISKVPPCAAPPLLPCNKNQSNLLVEGDVGVTYDLYILVLDGSASNGVAGAAFGIQFNGASGIGMDVFGWARCGASAEFSGGPGSISWPDSGSGNAIVWDTTDQCQDTSAPGDINNGVTAALGALYVYAYSPDVFSITRREYGDNPDFSVTDCQSNEDGLKFPESAGKVSFGIIGGYDPCH